MSPSVRHIFRWDLDKTYLRTEFDTVGDLVRTARLSAEERENIPGSAALIRELQADRSDDRVNEIFFISGSPQQLRGVIEKKFELDGFVPDGFVLKPAMSMIMRGRFRAIRGQVPYKLGALLRGRSEALIGTRETLVGDDAESDAFVYSLYADLVAGRVSDEVLTKLLTRAGAYSEQIDYVKHELAGVIHEDAVNRIIIHLDQLTPPAAFATYFPRVIPIYNHLQTPIVLFLDGTAGASAICKVTCDLIDTYGFEVKRLTNSAEDILRRLRMYYPLERLDELTAALTEVPADTLSEPAREVVAKIAERARYVRGRPLPRTPSVRRPKALDYLALYEQETARRDEAKRAKKLEARRNKKG